MKKTLITQKMQKLALSMLTFLFSFVALAQETAPKVEVNTSTKTTTTEEWYMNPTYMIIGAVLFIILIAIIVRGRGSKD